MENDNYLFCKLVSATLNPFCRRTLALFINAPKQSPVQRIMCEYNFIYRWA